MRSLSSIGARVLQQRVPALRARRSLITRFTPSLTRRGLQVRPQSSLSQSLETEAAEYQTDMEESTEVALSNLRGQLDPAMDLTEVGAVVELRFCPQAGVGLEGEVITVKFHCQDNGEMPNGADVDQAVGAPVDFNVLVEFDGIARAISFDCQGWNESIIIKEVHCYDDDMEPDAAYNGPVFSELEEDLQESFQEYLEARSVGPMFGTWITKFAYYKEQQCYGDWLQKLRGCIV